MVQGALRVVAHQVPPDPPRLFKSIPGVGVLTFRQIEQRHSRPQGVDEGSRDGSLFDDETCRQRLSAAIVRHRENRGPDADVGPIIAKIAEAEDVGLLIRVVTRVEDIAVARVVGAKDIIPAAGGLDEVIDLYLRKDVGPVLFGQR
jgi:hypothetical protein